MLTTYAHIARLNAYMRLGKRQEADTLYDELATKHGNRYAMACWHQAFLGGTRHQWSKWTKQGIR